MSQTFSCKPGHYVIRTETRPNGDLDPFATFVCSDFETSVIGEYPDIDPQITNLHGWNSYTDVSNGYLLRNTMDGSVNASAHTIGKDHDQTLMLLGSRERIQCRSGLINKIVFRIIDGKITIDDVFCGSISADVKKNLNSLPIDERQKLHDAILLNIKAKSLYKTAASDASGVLNELESYLQQLPTSNNELLQGYILDISADMSETLANLVKITDAESTDIVNRANDTAAIVASDSSNIPPPSTDVSTTDTVSTNTDVRLSPDVTVEVIEDDSPNYFFIIMFVMFVILLAYLIFFRETGTIIKKSSTR